LKKNKVGGERGRQLTRVSGRQLLQQRACAQGAERKRTRTHLQQRAVQLAAAVGAVLLLRLPLDLTHGALEALQQPQLLYVARQHRIDVGRQGGQAGAEAGRLAGLAAPAYLATAAAAAARR
jgi:hypothetical protein